MRTKRIVTLALITIISILVMVYSNKTTNYSVINTKEIKQLVDKENKIILSEHNKWKAVLNLDKYDEDGKVIKYKIDEKNMPIGYVKQIKENTITNHLNTYKYKVEYYFDGIKNNKLTEIGEAKYNQVISTYIDKKGENSRYKLDKTENLGLKISNEEEKNIMKIYYISKKFNIKLEQTIEKIILDNQEKQIKSDICKLEIPKNEVIKNIKIYYKIKITNNSEIIGNTEIYEQIPNGYIVMQENQEWNLQNNILTKKVENLQIGETREFTIILSNANKSIVPTIINNVIAQNSTNKLDIEESTLEDNSQKTKCIISTSTGIRTKIILYITLFILTNLALILLILRHKKYKNQ